MNTAHSISETAARVHTAITAAGFVDVVSVTAENWLIRMQANEYDTHQLKAAVEVARPILRGCGRSVTWFKVGGYKYFRVGESRSTMAVAFRIEMTEAETTSVLLGRHNLGTSFRP